MEELNSVDWRGRFIDDEEEDEDDYDEEDEDRPMEDFDPVSYYCLSSMLTHANKH